MESNGSSEQLTGPVSEPQELSAQMKMAKETSVMVNQLREVIERSSYLGRDAEVIGKGIYFLRDIARQAAVQIETLKRTERATRDAIRAVGENPPPQDAA